MTINGWLKERKPESPPRLLERIFTAVVESGEAGNSDIAAAARHAGVHLVDALLADKDETRAAALDLLTADALITYSCEAACDKPESLQSTVDESIERLIAAYDRAAIAARKNEN